MDSNFVHPRFCFSIVAVVVVLASLAVQVQAQVVSLDPAKLPRIGTVDERFASYNIEMAEVAGGTFWKPYHSEGRKPAESTSTPAGMDPNLYQYRPPINLTNPRLRKLAAPLDLLMCE